ncbi:D-amino acid dehydrogenase [Pseudothauera rhizosphaerae]|uniref:D-amino acid dehydrogenase n=1 Tax=Pseudothauera rhizosphaerae TaxID=2565932 RepID=A0A4S4AIX0_9RHOO|nr:D-amino acid dehydrogenase [Pseudothauera rhizosphaerae]THF59295.1 D-amino acid dehydrogenase [Pseudothauera rhizosphaerae]
MHVMVLGAGVTGITTAWYLRKAGFDVSVVDRQPAAGLETSYANGGQISVSHPEPWANPAAPLIALRWLGRSDAPLRFVPSRDPAQWRWALAFLYECLPARARRNTEAIASLALYSATRLRSLREELGLGYEFLGRGILHLFFGEQEFRKAAERVKLLAGHGIRARVAGREEMLALEPALAGMAARLAGGLYAPDDESGDAFRFTQALAQKCAEAGVRFYYDTPIRRLAHTGGLVEGIEVEDAAGRSGLLSAGAYVVCLGSYGPALVAPLGERLPIYPVKGYSITAPVADPARAPMVSLTDESARIVCSRLGNRLRVAGTAELNGFDTAPDPVRGQGILRWLEDRLPGAVDPAKAQLWAGLRPATPGNVPVIGKGGGVNLWYNTGHGTLGWTLACGSAAALAALMSGERPPVRFPFRPGR